MKVRMIFIPKNGQTTTSEITLAEANAIRGGALMRSGNVTIESIEGGGCKITDSGGETLLTAVRD